MHGTVRSSNTRVIGVPEEVQWKKKQKISEEVMAKNYSGL